MCGFGSGLRGANSPYHKALIYIWGSVDDISRAGLVR